MLNPRFSKFVVLAISVSMVASGVGGCGALKDIKSFTTHEGRRDLFSALVAGVRCEIGEAVKEQVAEYGGQLSWLYTWSALIAIKLTKQDGFGVNPGILFQPPLFGSIDPEISLGLGVGVRNDLTRDGGVTFFYPFKHLPEQKQGNGPCYRYGSILIDGNLELRLWLDAVLEPVRQCVFTRKITELPAIIGMTEKELAESRRQHCDAPENPIMTLTHTITFEVAFVEGVAPSFANARLSTSTSPLIEARQRISGVVALTLSPDQGGPKNSPYKSKLYAASGRRTFIGAPSDAQMSQNIVQQLSAAYRGF